MSSSVSATGITIKWNTNEASDSQVEYGPSSSFGGQTPLNTSMVTTHSQTLSGLSPNTTYSYRVKSKDAAGNTAVSATYTFVTSPGADTAAPVISSVSSSKNMTYVVITWSTNELSNSQLEYGLTTSYGQQTYVNTQMVTSHSVQLAIGSLSSATYHFRVKSADAAGNLAVSGDNTFSLAGSDNTPPTRSMASPSGILDDGTTEVVLYIATNEASTCRYSTNASAEYDAMTSNFTTADGISHTATASRSEERRVGKECRSRWSPYH